MFVELVLNRVSIRGSYVDVDPSGEDNHIDIHQLCELYVDVDPPLLMAIGKMYNLRSIIHHKKIEDDNARVVVEEVLIQMLTFLSLLKMCK